MSARCFAYPLLHKTAEDWLLCSSLTEASTSSMSRTQPSAHGTRLLASWPFQRLHSWQGSSRPSCHTPAPQSDRLVSVARCHAGRAQTSRHSLSSPQPDYTSQYRRAVPSCVPCGIVERAHSETRTAVIVAKPRLHDSWCSLVWTWGFFHLLPFDFANLRWPHCTQWCDRHHQIFQWFPFSRLHLIFRLTSWLAHSSDRWSCPSAVGLVLYWARYRPGLHAHNRAIRDITWPVGWSQSHSATRRFHSVTCKSHSYSSLEFCLRHWPQVACSTKKIWSYLQYLQRNHSRQRTVLSLRGSADLSSQAVCKAKLLTAQSHCYRMWCRGLAIELWRISPPGFGKCFYQMEDRLYTCL